jgi:hypothetical protein
MPDKPKGSFTVLPLIEQPAATTVSSSDVLPDELFALASEEPRTLTLAEPNRQLDQFVQDIYEQARSHRDALISFYVRYTWSLSIFVMILIFVQAGVRLFAYGEDRAELVPQWALNLIIVGMFGQFIGLLTIVTNRVWEFKPFLDYAQKSSKVAKTR